MRTQTTLMIAAVGLSLSGAAQAGTYCRTLTGEVEGFGQEYTRTSAERNRERAIEAELARWREMRREVVKVERGDAECKAVYPLGFEEWYCVAEAEVCVDR